LHHQVQTLRHLKNVGVIRKFDYAKAFRLSSAISIARQHGIRGFLKTNQAYATHRFLFSVFASLRLFAKSGVSNLSHLWIFQTRARAWLAFSLLIGVLSVAGMNFLAQALLDDLRGARVRNERDLMLLGALVAQALLSKPRTSVAELGFIQCESDGIARRRAKWL